MRSHSKAGRSLLLILLALGVASGCGGATLPEDTDSSAPELEVITQAEATGPYDGGWINRPNTLGSCDPAQTKAAFAELDRQWAFERGVMRNYVQCNPDGWKMNPIDRLAVIGHMALGTGCMGGSGTATQDSNCVAWNAYRSDLQDALRRRLARRAQWGEQLEPSEIFKEAMVVSRHSVPLALWAAYRVTNVMSGNRGVGDAAILGAMPNMRSTCSGLKDLESRGGIYYHFFLVGLISYGSAPSIGALSTMERFASMGTAPGDPDKAGANWEGVKAGNDFQAAHLERYTQASRCYRANEDNGALVIGETKRMVLDTNDKVTPRSLRTRQPPVLVASIGSAGLGLNVSRVTSTLASVDVSSSGPPGKREFDYSFGDGKEQSNTTQVVVDVQCPASKPDWDPAVSQCTARCGDCEGAKHCDTGSGTPTCKCPPENPDWNPTTQKCEPPLTCGGGSTASGGDEGYSKTLELGATSGTLSLSFQTYTQKDRLRVMYGGATLIDTGCVGASGTISAAYSGTSTQATMVVEPNCEGGSGTAWDFSFGCAR